MSGAIRQAFVEKLAEELTKNGATVKLVPMKGTDEVQQALIGKSLDLGIVMGGFTEENSQDLRELMPLYIEPLQLLVKENLYAEVSADFGKLRGKTINMDDQHTGTHALAWEVLRFADMIPDDLKVDQKLSFTPTFYNAEELKAVKDSDLPDALFVSAVVPSLSVQSLVKDHGYRIVQIPFGESFSLDRFRKFPASHNVNGTSLSVDKNYIYETSIPAFAYDVQP
ncbi:MAG: TAXI family TRAP transporter solute-binding subunit, partial [Bdellovibrionota bacterium]